MAYQLDDIDRQLLSLLQANARYTAIELAEEIGVSDNTIHNRMQRLEEAGIITGYTATIDHKEAEFELFFHFTCTARISDRSAMAEEVMAIPEIIEVTELMTGHENLLLKAIGATDEDITRIAEQVDQLNLEINDENMIRAEHTKPLDYVQLAKSMNED